MGNLLLLSHFSRVWPCATPETAAHQALLSLGFSRQEYWSGLPFTSPVANLDSILKSRDIPFLTKVYIVKAMVFPVVTYSCKGECRRIDAFKLCCWRRLESPLDSREIKPVSLKGNQPWILIGRTDAEAEVPILLPPDAKRKHIGKDPDAGRDWDQKEIRVTEDEMVEWHHQCNGQELGQTLGDAEGQGSLTCSVASQTWLGDWPAAIIYYHSSNNRITWAFVTTI